MLKVKECAVLPLLSPAQSFMMPKWRLVTSSNGSWPPRGRNWSIKPEREPVTTAWCRKAQASTGVIGITPDTSNSAAYLFVCAEKDKVQIKVEVCEFCSIKLLSKIITFD